MPKTIPSDGVHSRGEKNAPLRHYDLGTASCLDSASGNEAKKCQNILLAALKNAGESRKNIKLGWKSHHKDEPVYWIKKHRVWWKYEKWEEKYWHMFGIADTKEDLKNESLVCQFSIPMDSAGMKSGTARFLKDTSGRYYIGHTGVIMKGQKRVTGPSDFAGWQKTDICNNKSQIIVISALDDDRVVERICRFVQTAQTYKTQKKTIRDTEVFPWIEFYSEFADKLATHSNDRRSLVKKIHETYKVMQLKMTDEFSDGTRIPLDDICPFTTISLFNRGLTDENRERIAGSLADFLRVKSKVPDSFDGIPVLHNLKHWFFRFKKDRGGDDINSLWRVFAHALKYADNYKISNHKNFIKSFDEAIKNGVSHTMLTIGLYWIRPHMYLPMDSKTVQWIERELEIRVPKKNPNAEEYLQFVKKIKSRLEADKNNRSMSLPELSHMAYVESRTSKTIQESESAESFEPHAEYTTSDIIAEGAFVEKQRLEEMLEFWEKKKNIILQGSPGTGKTWLAKKLAFALTGHKSDPCVRVFQFHPNISYEDFVRGWRPISTDEDSSGAGRLALVDGPFLKSIQEAIAHPNRKFVVVIEEINRGNPANILGEMLTLLEADKRVESEALELGYANKNDGRVYIPENFYVIGTMNVADRSIAMIDMALRRRFGFYNLEPVLGKVWKDHVHEKNGIKYDTLDMISNNISSLNKVIREDAMLGPHFVIGHSYVTPSDDAIIVDPTKWFEHIVNNEIGPLLSEYWVEDQAKADEQKRKLLDGFAK